MDDYVYRDMSNYDPDNKIVDGLREKGLLNEKYESPPSSEEALAPTPTEAAEEEEGFLESAIKNPVVSAALQQTAKMTNPVFGRAIAAGVGALSADTKEEADKNVMDNIGGELALVDFGMDAIGNIPGAASIDDSWDEVTKFSNPNMQAVRDVASVIVPSMALTMAAGPLGAKGAAAVGGGKIVQGLSAISATAATDVAVTALSDYSERDEGMARGLDNFLESIGRPLGLKIPQAITVMDDDSPEVRQRKLMFETAGLSIIGDALGYMFSAGKPVLNWFQPKDEVAETFKQVKIRENPDPDTVFRTMELDEEIMQLDDEIFAAGDADVSELIARRDFLQEEAGALYNTYFNTGRTSATADPLESYVATQKSTRDYQTDQIGAQKIQENPELSEFDPNVQALIGDESARPRQSIPRANVARNAADIAAMESGAIAPGVPAPMLTDAMLKKGIGLDDTSRDAVVKLTDTFRESGKFDAVVDGVRFTKADMNDNAWNLTAKILEAPDAEELKKAFIDLKAERQISNNYGINTLTDAVTPDVGRAISILTKEFLGDEVTAMSTKAMQTTAKEIDTHVESMRIFKGQVDEDAVNDIILDKLQFLTEEYGISKYIAGWSLRNFGWWQQKIPALQKKPEVILQEMTAMANSKKKSAQVFIADLKRLQVDQPETARTLTMAYGLTNGDVDTMAKLSKWAKDQLSIGSVFVSPKDGETIFSKGVWSVVYNNALSGLSAGRAAVGNTSALALKPIDYMVGAGIRGVLKRDFEPVRRGFYAFGIQREVIGSALTEGWNMFKKASNDPDLVRDIMRKDYAFDTEEMSWAVMNRMEQEFIKNDQVGQLAMLRWAQVNRTASKSKFMRYSQNAMIGIDTMSNYMQGTMVSKLRAWDDVYTKGQHLDVANLRDAQKQHLDKIFDPKTGRISDEWVTTQATELALNQTTQFGESISAMIQQYPALRAAVMFPTTGIAFVRKSMSYTPFQFLPGSQKYGKTILAQTDEQVAEVLTLHGIKPDDPQGRMIVDNLKTEYMGRVATGAMVVAGLGSFAFSGNIRGNYPKDPRDKQFLIENKWKPKTIRLGGAWVSYDGIVPLDPLLTMLGDMAYYANDIGSPFMEDIQGKLAWTITQSFSGATPLQGLEPLVAIAQGDETAMSRFLANTSRLAIPLSSGQGVLAKAVDSTTKEIYNDVQGYINSRIPFVNLSVPEKFDWWTGERVNDIDNPILRIMNAVNPLPTTQTEEPWRLWLLNSGLNLSTLVLKDTSGAYEYSAEQRSIMSKYIGEQAIWKEVEQMRTNPKYNNQLDEIRAELATGKSFDELQPDIQNLEVNRRLKTLVLTAKKIAEQRMYSEYPEIQELAKAKNLAKNYMTQGRVKDSFGVAEKAQQNNNPNPMQQVQKLLQFR